MRIDNVGVGWECRIPDDQLYFAHVGEALNEHDRDDGAVGNRGVRHVYRVHGMWESDDPRAGAIQQWIRNVWKQFRPFSIGGVTTLTSTPLTRARSASDRRTVTIRPSRRARERVRSGERVPDEPKHQAGVLQV